MGPAQASTLSENEMDLEYNPSVPFDSKSATKKSGNLHVFDEDLVMLKKSHKLKSLII